MDMNCRSTVFSIAAAFVLSASMDALGVVLDKDYAKGERTFEGGDIVDLNGHRLYIDSAELNAVKFVDLSSGKKGELHVFVDEGSNCNLGSLDVSGNLKIVKYGKGGLTVPATGVELKCAEGRLGVGGKLPIHRWSFTDGSLVDSVGGVEAVQVGSASLENNAVTFPGGVNGSCYLDLGKDVLPSTGDATIELWGRRNEAKHQWASMFSIGVNGNNANSLRMAWSNHDAGDGKTDMVYLKKNGGNVFFISNTMSPYVVGTMYHISMRFKQKSDGSTEITWAKRNVETGAIEKTHTEVVSKDIWSLAEYAGNPLVLNHGYDNDDEAATYDEVRIWKGALTDDQLSLNAKLGPDKTIAHPSSGRCGIVEVSEGAVLATPDTGVDCERLTGAGTLEAPSSLTVGTLDIAGDGFGTFTVDGYLKVAGDWLFGAGAGSVDRIVGAGTLDLSEANLEPSFTQDAFGSNLMASGVAVSGYEQMTLPDGMDIKYKSGNLRLISSGFMILIK